MKKGGVAFLLFLLLPQRAVCQFGGCERGRMEHRVRHGLGDV